MERLTAQNSDKISYLVKVFKQYALTLITIRMQRRRWYSDGESGKMSLFRFYGVCAILDLV